MKRIEVDYYCANCGKKDHRIFQNSDSLCTNNMLKEFILNRNVLFCSETCREQFRKKLFLSLED